MEEREASIAAGGGIGGDDEGKIHRELRWWRQLRGEEVATEGKCRWWRQRGEEVSVMALQI